MQLPFTEEQFFDLLAEYNSALWPALVVLWSGSVAATILMFSPGRSSDRWISALLALHWLWSGLAFHLAFFTRINAAAWLFGALFIVEGALILWIGVVQGRLSFAPERSAWTPVAWALVAYSLVYPVINAVQYSGVSRIPAFGVPCPTTIFTAGMLMLATPRWRRLGVVPLIWSGIGGSAANLFGVTADYALPIAGIALAIFFSRRREDGAVRGGPEWRRRTAASAIETDESRRKALLVCATRPIIAPYSSDDTMRGSASISARSCSGSRCSRPCCSGARRERAPAPSSTRHPWR